MGFGAPKLPKQDNTLARQQAEENARAIKASEDQAAAARRLASRPVEPLRISPQGTLSPADIAAAQRQRVVEMGKKKGIQWTLDPSRTLGGAALL